MGVRIYSPSKNPLQSGRGKLGRWVLEFDSAGAKSTEPLMGWTSSTDTSSQIKLTFDDKEAAIAYAEKNGLEYVVQEPKTPKRIIRAYSDNFTYTRREPWSH
ncbi:MAG: ETC complex I subunit [Hyphomonadaceae bacterium]|nr:MAG: ETC complex I subunit [Hyphomonadaceae bacterium]KAF0186210.1 MAG: ETC complex I subunit [Hyphomonadaceae bacterium]